MFKVYDEAKERYIGEIAAFLPLSRAISILIFSIFIEYAIYRDDHVSIWPGLGKMTLNVIFIDSKSFVRNLHLLSIFIAIACTLILNKINFIYRKYSSKIILIDSTIRGAIEKIITSAEKVNSNYFSVNYEIASDLEKKLSSSKLRMSSILTLSYISLTICIASVLPYFINLHFPSLVDFLVIIISCFTYIYTQRLSIAIYIKDYFPLLVHIKALKGEEIDIDPVYID